ncbi:hypothetical protein H6G89_21575 [Oscillatoria sp. FACHB-1407]|uniref:hypothetical protein n=1 Tax=Oscillatoria sp. FACHB-1407 TaxID=2692847 RepID=UPI00168222C4|nr:hypothetical protein [Oscillatoria sp. FACHB-1407]MBD2463596.1 hypothetical protein [Oscillatoria sp. FACHB-1407]
MNIVQKCVLVVTGCLLAGTATSQVALAQQTGEDNSVRIFRLACEAYNAGVLSPEDFIIPQGDYSDMYFDLTDACPQTGNGTDLSTFSADEFPALSENFELLEPILEAAVARQ